MIFTSFFRVQTSVSSTRGDISSFASPSASSFASTFGPPFVSPFGQSIPSTGFAISSGRGFGGYLEGYIAEYLVGQHLMLSQLYLLPQVISVIDWMVVL